MSNFVRNVETYLDDEFKKKLRDKIESLGLSPAEFLYLMNYKSHIGLIITVSFLDMINRNILDTNSSEVPRIFDKKR